MFINPHKLPKKDASKKSVINLQLYSNYNNNSEKEHQNSTVSRLFVLKEGHPNGIQNHASKNNTKW